MQSAPEDAETRRGLKRSAELPIDDPRSEVRGRGLHLDDDVPIVTPTVQQTERPADAAEAHMSMGRMELISSAAAKMMNAAVKCELTSAEVWEHPCQGSQTNPQVMASIQLSSSTLQQDVTTDDSGTSERKRTEKYWSKCNKNIRQNS